MRYEEIVCGSTTFILISWKAMMIKHTSMFDLLMEHMGLPLKTFSKALRI